MSGARGRLDQVWAAGAPRADADTSDSERRSVVVSAGLWLARNAQRPPKAPRAMPSDAQRFCDDGATGDDLGQQLTPLCDPCHSPAAPYTPASTWRYDAANAVDRRALGRAESGLHAFPGMLSVRPQMPPEFFRDRTSVDGGWRRSFAEGRRGRRTDKSGL